MSIAKIKKKRGEGEGEEVEGGGGRKRGGRIGVEPIFAVVCSYQRSL